MSWTRIAWVSYAQSYAEPSKRNHLNLDTHILVYALQNHLRGKERRLLAQDSWGISAIVLWELVKLCQLKRISLDLDSPGFTRALSRIHVWPLDLRVCLKTMELDFHSDPTDKIIAATSIIYKVPLLTRDQTILGSKLVPLAK